MARVIPPDTRASGNTGHIGDHNNLSDLMTLMLQRSVYNVMVAPYSAAGDGVTDDTSAINAAATAASNAGGGLLYFPPGKYKTTSAITYSGSGPVGFVGSLHAGSPNATTLGSACIHMAFAPGHALSVTNAQYCMISDLDFATDVSNTSGSTADHVAVYLSGVHTYSISRVHTFDNSGGNGVNTGFEAVSCYDGLVQDCYWGAVTQGVWFNGNPSGAGMTLRNCQLDTGAGNGYGGIRMDNSAATLNIDTCYTYHSDNGLICLGSGNAPTFIYINNFQVNNSRVSGISLQAGSQFWANQLWISMAGTPSSYATRGIYFQSGYQGWAYIANSVIQGPSQDGIYIAGGQGFHISSTSIGGCGFNASNTYSDISIASGVSNVTVQGCHLDVDKYNGLTSNANKPKAAISLPSSGVSNIHLVGNMALSSGYGTSTLVDSGALATKYGNIGF